MTSVYERSMMNTVSKELVKTADEAARVYAAGKPLSIAIDGHSARMKNILLTSYKAIYPVFGDRITSAAKGAKVLTELKKPNTVPKVDTFEQIMLDWAEENAAEKVVLISATTEDHIRRAIQRGIDNGESREIIAHRIKLDTGGAIAQARSLVIATTEVHTTASTANYEMASALGIDGMKRAWLPVEDARTRPDHAAMAGMEPIGMDDKYDVGGEQMQFPGDASATPGNTVNCRCTEEFIVN
jgi:uncharacterized protein with gpF-like domain